LAGVWTRYWLALVPPAAAGFLFALGVFKFAIYFGDMRGEPTVSMWHYILNPSLGELLYAAAAGVATLAGWFLWRRVRAGRS
jgi:hypothetical protein